jgi:hypothetical protein
MRRLFSDVAKAIDEMVPMSRERSIAHTELQSAARAANAAIVANDPGARPEDSVPLYTAFESIEPKEAQ